jgi:hypothetical protein
MCRKMSIVGGDSRGVKGTIQLISWYCVNYPEIQDSKIWNTYIQASNFFIGVETRI